MLQMTCLVKQDKSLIKNTTSSFTMFNLTKKQMESLCFTEYHFLQGYCMSHSDWSKESW